MEHMKERMDEEERTLSVLQSRSMKSFFCKHCNALIKPELCGNPGAQKQQAYMQVPCSRGQEET